MGQLLRLDYDELKYIVKAFKDSGEDVVQLHCQTRQKVHDLKGEWMGEGADAFFAEMEEELLPAMARLAQAMFVGQEVLLKIMKIVEDTDLESADTFKREVGGESEFRPSDMGTVMGGTAGVQAGAAGAVGGAADQGLPQPDSGAGGPAGTGPGTTAGTGPVDAGAGVDQGSVGTGDTGYAQSAGGAAVESQFEAAGASEGQSAGGSAGAGGAATGGGGGGSGGGSRSGGSGGLDGLGGGVGARTEGGAFTPGGTQTAQDHIWGSDAAGGGAASQPGESADAGGGAGASIGKEGAAGAAVAGVGAAAAAGVVIKTAKKKKE
jgi:WXG100 family type VII secretion target